MPNSILYFVQECNAKETYLKGTLENINSEAPGQAPEAGWCEPHDVQQGEVQGPAPASISVTIQDRR